VEKKIQYVDCFYLGDGCIGDTRHTRLKLCTRSEKNPQTKKLNPRAFLYFFISEPFLGPKIPKYSKKAEVQDFQPLSNNIVYRFTKNTPKMCESAKGSKWLRKNYGRE